jgi:hypothetical protein
MMINVGTLTSSMTSRFDDLESCLVTCMGMRGGRRRMKRSANAWFFSFGEAK